MQLNEFLVRAKRKTYASNTPSIILPNGSKQLTYAQEDWLYQDTYFGFNPFSGQEIVWKNKTPIWSMNYYGSAQGPSPKEIYTFLKQALKSVSVEHPFRGPHLFRINNFIYINQHTGNLEKFQGLETILHHGEEIYQLNYLGGRIKKK